MTVFVDTSAWAAYFNKKDSNHREAMAIWKRLRDKKAKLVTTDYIFDETMTLLKVRGSSDIAITAGKALLASNIVQMVKITEDGILRTFDLFEKYREHPFSFTDCVSLEVMKNRGLKSAFTFDSDFKVMGFEVLKA